MAQTSKHREISAAGHHAPMERSKAGGGDDNNEVQKHGETRQRRGKSAPSQG
jgi:hypothetical protein